MEGVMRMAGSGFGLASLKARRAAGAKSNPGALPDTGAISGHDAAAGLGATATAEARGPQMPLTFRRSGDAASVAKVRGRGEVHHHLENLGFVEGAPVRVVSEQGGNLIVEVKGAQVALDRTVASKIITAAA